MAMGQLDWSWATSCGIDMMHTCSDFDKMHHRPAAVHAIVDRNRLLLSIARV